MVVTCSAVFLLLLCEICILVEEMRRILPPDTLLPFLDVASHTRIAPRGMQVRDYWEILLIQCQLIIVLSLIVVLFCEPLTV